MSEKIEGLQYWRPWPLRVGDCMPFYHGGEFHLFYLTDRLEDVEKGIVGRYEWGHISSRDLIQWQEYPRAIKITKDNEDAIATGSVYYHDNRFWGFYATQEAKDRFHLSLAMSDDLVHFKKVQKDPYIETPEGYGKVARDAIVFTDEEGGFHLYSTTFLPEGDKEIGCLLHMVSDDMIDWREGEPVVTGGVQPECPDHFYWNGWYYLLYNEVGMTQYRMSRNATGPWIDPGYSPFEGSDAIVMKTAAFGEGRRIGVTWASIPKLGWGGKVVFREVIQHEDGRLGVKFVDEMIPQMKEKLEISFRPIIGNAEFDGKRMHLQALGKKSGAAIHSGGNCRMRLKVIPSGENCEFGIGFGVAEGDTESNIVCFSAKEKTVKIEAGLFMLREVDGLDKPFELDIVVCDDIIDMCIDKRRTYLRMIDGLEFDELRLFCWRGEVGFESIEINEISGKRV